jgi:hypothetical protein
VRRQPTDLGGDRRIVLSRLAGLAVVLGLEHQHDRRHESGQRQHARHRDQHRRVPRASRGGRAKYDQPQTGQRSSRVRASRAQRGQVRSGASPAPARP